ncbi:MAG: GNAT family N-acetyltransferase [Candidatus Levybacteria bacterium]|nr:GNAT family N-acetyltransferase [Candidatus Levybacteria bacterium]
MQIREAILSDYKEMMSLYNDFVGEDRYSKLDNDSFSDVLNSPNNFVFVAQEQQKIVGFATFSVRRVIRYKNPIAELDELYVIPEYRKRGVGKTLMEQVLKKAKELNCYRVFIESQYKHEIGHKFYEALGFKNYGYHFIKDL